VIVARLWGRCGLNENRRFLLFDAITTPLAAILYEAWLVRSVQAADHLGWDYLKFWVRSRSVCFRAAHPCDPKYVSAHVMECRINTGATIDFKKFADCKQSAYIAPAATVT
jgi:hypothetical protein